MCSCFYGVLKMLSIKYTCLLEFATLAAWKLSHIDFNAHIPDVYTCAMYMDDSHILMGEVHFHSIYYNFNGKPNKI